jgi:hypothetical protein
LGEKLKDRVETGSGARGQVAVCRRILGIVARRAWRPLPTTIDEVLVRLNALLDDAVRKGVRIGYFVALYERVTSNVRRALIAGNVFDDGQRMEQLDVVFANRFLEAWDQHVGGETPTESWAVAFRALDDPGVLVVQHLMLGMNAHINLDLGVAAATVAPTPDALAALRADFMRINDVLARLVRMVEDRSFKSVRRCSAWPMR